MARIHPFQVPCWCNRFCWQWRTSVIFANQNTLHVRNYSCGFFACVTFGASIMVLFWPKSLVLIDPNNNQKRVRSVLHESSLVKVTTTILDFQWARKMFVLLNNSSDGESRQSTSWYFPNYATQSKYLWRSVLIHPDKAPQHAIYRARES